MFLPPSMRSVPASSRTSMFGPSTAVPSEANLTRLRSRLRQSGAIMSSRSAVSRADAHLDFEVVDVGEGHQPTGVEHLLARLEQHGLRRRLVAEDDAAAYAVDVAARADEERHREKEPTSSGDEEDCLEQQRGVESHDMAAGTPSRATVSKSMSPSRHVDPDAREPYYYLCVPCELRLTRISRRAPQWRALEDVHFHFSSAAHRSTASWMADDDIDETLRCNPLVAPTSQYSRIFLNGVPTLLSRRPGGGDMFYPLPHEVDAVRPPPRGQGVGHVSGLSSRETSIDAFSDPFQLFPPLSARGEHGGAAVLWHRAIPSVYTAKVQLPRRAGLVTPPTKPQLGPKREHPQGKVYRVERYHARAQVHVDHVDLHTYRQNSLLPSLKHPLIPVVLPIHRARMAKSLLKLEASPSTEKFRKSEKHGTHNSNNKPARESIHIDDPHRVVYTQSYVPIAEGLADAHRQGGRARTAELPTPLKVFEEESYRVALVSDFDQRRRQNRLCSLSPRGSTHEKAAPVVLTRALLTQHTQSTSNAWQSPTASATGASMGSSMQPASNSRLSSAMWSSAQSDPSSNAEA